MRTTIPGPDRKRTPCEYRYRLIYRSENPQDEGCVLAWEVLGGRMIYQIALEREEAGDLRAHCTCADAIYRGDQPGHVCKHVQGLLQLGTEMYHELSGPAYSAQPEVSAEAA
ncbi:MAG: hypothetical protein ACFCD0_05945 [Gemmataceae bacterium]